MTGVVLAAVAAAVTPMIAAAFLWPKGWPLIWRQLAIALWGLGVVFAVERWLGGAGFGRTVAALGARWPRRDVVLVALLAPLAMVLVPPILATAGSASWRLQPGWLPILVGVILVNGLAEEVIHRGFLFRHLREGRSFGAAAAVAGAIFAAQHLYLVTVVGLVAGLASVALALLLNFPFVYFYETGGRSILPPAILHTGCNAPALLLLAQAEQRSLAMPYMAAVLAALYGAMALLVLARRNHV